MEIRQLNMPYNQSCLSMRVGRFQQVDIPLKEGVKKDEEDFNNFKEKDLGIQDSEVETPPEKAGDNKHLLLKEEEVREQANYAEENAIIRGSVVLLVQQGLSENHENIWYLDSRASNHMYGQRGLFSDLDETIQGLITLGDTSKVPVKGKDNIPIKLKNGDHSYIANVYYVPAIKHNILSIGQLIEKGYTLYTKNCHMIVKYYNGRLIAYVKMSKNRMFLLNIQYDAAKCLSAITNNEEWL
ncbi:uncharacterized protein [Populus alba]|uniref:uncharacterized protein n=1 Tax=Populus alba TaxID=43335 RepID=UPI0015884B5D|nr:uncharacterized protein LOC118046249 [Populus alba]